jgi:hypothetical protein
MKYNIVYLTLGGGKFLGQLLTVGLDNLAKEYFDLYDKNHVPWMEREDMFYYNENIGIYTSNGYTFSEIADLENLIFINTSDEESINRIEKRNQCVSTSMKNPRIRDIRLKYHNECHGFLRHNNINFFDFDYGDFWNRDKFLQSMTKFGKYFNIDFKTEVLLYAQKKWIYSNIQKMNKR